VCIDLSAKENALNREKSAAAGLEARESPMLLIKVFDMHPALRNDGLGVACELQRFPTGQDHHPRRALL
jgi:hypothetical protein